ncbi:hypothetical protein [Olivibacter domesticus]|nr:hypothetical protein [Olivibacter domesticus]
MMQNFRSSRVCGFFCVILLSVFTVKVNRSIATLLSSKINVTVKLMEDVEEAEQEKQEEKKDAEKHKGFDYHAIDEKKIAWIFPKGCKKGEYPGRSAYPTDYLHSIPVPPPDGTI